MQWRADPETIAVEVESAGNKKVVADRLDERILLIRKGLGTLKNVKGRGATETDVLVIDVDCTNKADKQPLSGEWKRL